MERCMLTKNTYEIMRIVETMYDWHNDPMVTFGPVIDNQFLTEDCYQNKNYWGLKVPTIVGFNNNAGAFKWITLLNDKNLMMEMINNFDSVMPYMFYYNHLDQQDKMKITMMLREFYFKNKDMTNIMDMQEGFINVSGSQG